MRQEVSQMVGRIAVGLLVSLRVGRVRHGETLYALDG